MLLQCRSHCATVELSKFKLLSLRLRDRDYRWESSEIWKTEYFNLHHQNHPHYVKLLITRSEMVHMFHRKTAEAIKFSERGTWGTWGTWRHLGLRQGHLWLLGYHSTCFCAFCSATIYPFWEAIKPRSVSVYYMSAGMEHKSGIYVNPVLNFPSS